jgi:hypothetical protein
MHVVSKPLDDLLVIVDVQQNFRRNKTVRHTKVSGEELWNSFLGKRLRPMQLWRTRCTCLLLPYFSAMLT